MDKGFERIVPGRSRGYLIDVEKFGAIYKGERYRAGYTQMTAFASAIEDQFGVSYTSDHLYEFQNGRVPPLETFLMIVATLNPPGGISAFADCIRPDVAERLFGSRKD